MNFKLKPREKLSTGIRRIARKQLGRAAELLRQDADPQGPSVHAARQWLKKARATLQLVRPALGGGRCKREDGKLRDIARGLARRRDAEVLVLTLETLRSGRRELAEDRVWEKLQQIFLKRRDEFSDELREEKRRCRIALRAARRSVSRWPLTKLRRPELCRGLARVYREGRRAMRAAEKSRATGDLHEWRKHVKELWYGLRMIEPELPSGMAGVTNGMKELGEHLGNDHDLALLETALATCKLKAEELKPLKVRVKARRAALQQAAFKQGRRLFAKDVAEFVKRLK